ncbi:MAG TPA: acyl-CoA dehydrogenase [Alcaligenes sp.]|nr:acyl-CoA dehydrogenase [Alcaligenes sp.]HRL27234.1 acyl-CoA dehydrogenase [Alcaligenes sp.]
MDWKAWRRKWLTIPLYRMGQNALPRLSATERQAIEAGDAWWEAELFSGRPDWQKLLAVPPARLDAHEQAFIDGPVAQLCKMLDEWDNQWHRGDLPAEVWIFLREHGFFGLIIPAEYGGLGFSAYAHSEVVRQIAVRSVTAAVTVMVPNSLGPGELLLQFGTDEQRRHWLPRLASGQDIPCFGLTSPEAGSDAAAMLDTGVVCRQDVDGQSVLGIRLNWAKRYITLAPVATVLGLAFKLQDPDGLLGDDPEPGISVALVPTDLPGITIGRRHLPAMQVFQNGPTQGRDVFVPLDALIGGPAQAGKGWVMLMSALAAGRGISLPSLAASACLFAAHTSGAYARVRTQFGIPIGKFEGVQEQLGRMAGNAYVVEAARRMTCAGLDQGVKPAVASAIMKLHCTERMRESVNAAMDVHAGKAVIDGPSNYLSGLYRALPVAITVEGANILTRSLIVFGQGAIRSHPWLMQEVQALSNPDSQQGEDDFDAAIWRHLGHSVRNALRATALAWTGGLVGRWPRQAGEVAPVYRRLDRYSAAFSLVAECALLSLGGNLKRKEMLSARLGDMLAELFLLSAVLKRWNDEGRHHSDLALVHWCAQDSLARLDRRMDEVLSNLPSRPLAWVLRVLLRPFGLAARGPSDDLTRKVAQVLLEPSGSRDRLVGAVWEEHDTASVTLLERAFSLAVQVQPLLDQVRKAGLSDWRIARDKGAITAEQALQIEAYQQLVAEVIAVDDFPSGVFGHPHDAQDDADSQEHRPA